MTDRLEAFTVRKDDKAKKEQAEPRKVKLEPNRHLPAYPNRFAAKRRQISES